MKNYIKNHDQLLSHGDKVLRAVALEMVNAALEASNPFEATKNLVHLRGDRLQVGPHIFDLSKPNKIYVLGTGKATFPIAKALDEILGDR